MTLTLSIPPMMLLLKVIQEAQILFDRLSPISPVAMLKSSHSRASAISMQRGILSPTFSLEIAAIIDSTVVMVTIPLRGEWEPINSNSTVELIRSLILRLHRVIRLEFKQVLTTTFLSLVATF